MCIYIYIYIEREREREREGQRTSHCKSVHAYIIIFFSKFIVFFSEFPSPLKFTLKC